MASAEMSWFKGDVNGYGAAPVEKEEEKFDWWNDFDAKAVFVIGMMTSALTLLEFVYAMITGSLTLVADAFHRLSDVMTMGCTFYAIILSHKPSSSKYSYGWKRAEVLGGLCNAVFLLALCFFMAEKIIRSFIEHPKVSKPLQVAIVGAAGLIVCILGLFMFDGAGHTHAGGEKCTGHGNGDAGHSHSHGDTTCGGHGVPEAAPSGHSHAGGAPCGGHGVPPKDGGGHGHGVPPKDGGGHGHGVPPKDGGGHGHGVPPKDGGGHGHGGAKKDGGGHGHGGAKKDPVPAPAGGHSHGGAACSGHGSGNGILTTSAHGVGSSSGYEKIDDRAEEEVFQAVDATNVNMWQLYLHLVGDVLGALFIIAEGLICYFWEGDEWTDWIDPSFSLIIVSLILATTIPVVQKTADTLYQTVPDEIDLVTLENDVRKLDGVDGCHELHVWRLVNDVVIGTAHIRTSLTGDASMNLLKKIKDQFHKRSVHSLTIQIEYASVGVTSNKTGKSKSICGLPCVEDCNAAKCC